MSKGQRAAQPQSQDEPPHLVPFLQLAHRTGTSGFSRPEGTSALVQACSPPRTGVLPKPQREGDWGSARALGGRDSACLRTSVDPPYLAPKATDEEWVSQGLHHTGCPRLKLPEPQPLPHGHPLPASSVPAAWATPPLSQLALYLPRKLCGGGEAPAFPGQVRLETHLPGAMEQLGH